MTSATIQVAMLVIPFVGEAGLAVDAVNAASKIADVADAATAIGDIAEGGEAAGALSSAAGTGEVADNAAAECAGEGCFIAGTRVAVGMMVEEGPAAPAAWWEVEGGSRVDASGSVATAGGVAEALAARVKVCYDTIAIEDLREGMVLLAGDELDPTAIPRPARVSRVIRKIADHLRILTIEDADGTRQTLYTTDAHPIWIDGLGWVLAGTIHPGQRLTQADGRESEVISSEREAHPQGIEVFNLQIDAGHTYFVVCEGSDAAPVWVHNIVQCGGGASAEAAKDLLSQQGISEQTASDTGLAEQHHIVTTYEGAGDDAAASREILANAGFDLEDEANLADVPGHYGPHPPEYHAEVLDQLQNGVRGLEVGSDAYRQGVQSALLDLNNQLMAPDNWLTSLITR